MKKINYQRGFTLVELIFVIMIIAILSVFVAKFMAQSVAAYLAAENVTNTTWQGRLAYARFLRDTRQIRSPSDITNLTSTELTFTDMTGNTYDYIFNGTTLTLNGNILADGVTGSFAYTDVNNAVTAVTANVVYVTMTITVTQKNANLNFSGTAELRNFNT